MKCTHPKRLLVKSLGTYIDVPCGHCMACRLNYSQQWAIRMMNEKNYYSDDKCCFITLTYDDEHLPKDKSVHKEELQKFFKRLRKSIYPQKIKYVACGEYGDQFGRPHYHAIIFGWQPSKDFEAMTRRGNKYYNSRELFDLWLDDKGESIGFASFGNVTYESCRYVASYIVKQHRGFDKSYYDKNGINPEFVLMSQGLGKRYALKNKEELQKRGFLLFQGYKYPIPRYYENLVYDTDELKQQRRKEKENVVKQNEKRFEESLDFNEFDRFSYSIKKFVHNAIKVGEWLAFKRFENNQNREKRLKIKVEKHK